MFKRVLVFILGIIMCASALNYIIIYLNLLNMGYSFEDYVKFIIKRVECWSLILGIILIIISILKRKEKRHDLCV